MKEESNVLSPFSATCCSRFCLNVITAMSEEATLHASLAAPPFAAIHRSSSDKILAAVTEDISDLEFVFLKPVTCFPLSRLTAELGLSTALFSFASLPSRTQARTIFCQMMAARIARIQRSLALLYGRGLAPWINSNSEKVSDTASAPAVSNTDLKVAVSLCRRR